MLFDAQQLPELKEFIDETADKDLYKWWAQYAESNARFKEALTYYEKASDHMSIVRVLAFHNKLDRAAEVVHASNDAGAAYHLAKQFEEKVNANHGDRGMVQQAIQLYQRAGRFNHAIRLAKEHDLAGDLNMMALGSVAPKQLADTAAYFETSGQPDKAVALHHKAGNTAKAVELCFQFSLFEQLSQIAEDPTLLEKGDPHVRADLAPISLRARSDLRSPSECPPSSSDLRSPSNLHPISTQSPRNLHPISRWRSAAARPLRRVLPRSRPVGQGRQPARRCGRAVEGARPRAHAQHHAD